MSQLETEVKSIARYVACSAYSVSLSLFGTVIEFFIARLIDSFPHTCQWLAAGSQAARDFEQVQNLAKLHKNYVADFARPVSYSEKKVKGDRFEKIIAPFIKRADPAVEKVR